MTGRDDENVALDYHIRMIQRVLAFALSLTAAAFGQSNQASISGVVTDAQGAVVPGATVTAANAATDRRTTTVTNESGFYSIPNLPIGSYTVSVERQGFRRYERKDVTLTTSQILELAIRLELGAVAKPLPSPARHFLSRPAAPTSRN